MDSSKVNIHVHIHVQTSISKLLTTLLVTPINSKNPPNPSDPPSPNNCSNAKGQIIVEFSQPACIKIPCAFIRKCLQTKEPKLKHRPQIWQSSGSE
jgi:hypothetical protein